MSNLPYTYDPRADQPTWKKWTWWGLIAILVAVFAWRTYEKYYVGLPYGPGLTWPDVAADAFFILVLGWTIYRSVRRDPWPALAVDESGIRMKLLGRRGPERGRFELRWSEVERVEYGASKLTFYLREGRTTVVPLILPYAELQGLKAALAQLGHGVTRESAPPHPTFAPPR